MSAGEMIIAVLGALGGASVLVLGLGAWLGKVWADRIAETERSRHARELEELRASLSRLSQDYQRISNARFESYSELWGRLQDVKTAGDRLWEDASRERLEEFAIVLNNSRVAVNRGRLILGDTHYRDLDRLLSSFENYRLGKARVIELRSVQDFGENLQLGWEQHIRDQIEANAEARSGYERVLNEVLREFRLALGLAA